MFKKYCDALKSPVDVDYSTSDKMVILSVTLTAVKQWHWLKKPVLNGYTL